MKIQLAQSYWPRSGYDKRNSSHVPIEGAKNGKILREVILPQSDTQNASKKRWHLGGCVITEEETLHVVYDGILSAMTLQGEILWSLELQNRNHEKSSYSSQPAALHGGATVVTHDDVVTVINVQGEIMHQIYLNAPIDDSGPSPNVTDDHHLIVTCITGEVFVIQENGHVSEIGCFGYDIVPPAIYDDNSFVIAGYYGTGFCRVQLDGQHIWTTDFGEADLLPTIHTTQCAAVGSLNDRQSIIFSPSGERIGHYERASIFAEYSESAWIAYSDQYIAKLTLEGKELWGHPTPTKSSWGSRQPIVDASGYIYFATANDIVCLDSHGNTVFERALQEEIQGGLSIVAPGQLAYISQGNLTIMG